MQRPRLSVPNGYGATPSSDHTGGSSMLARSWSAGSLGAICGPNNAQITMTATIIAPTTTFGERTAVHNAAFSGDHCLTTGCNTATETFDDMGSCMSGATKFGIEN